VSAVDEKKPKVKISCSVPLRDEIFWVIFKYVVIDLATREIADGIL
jgi:septum formation topological specificity factor MinE